MNDRRLRLSYDRLLAIRAESARRDCPALDALVNLVLQEGPEEFRLELLDHVMACPFCGAEFGMLRAVAQAQGEVV